MQLWAICIFVCHTAIASGFGNYQQNQIIDSTGYINLGSNRINFYIQPAGDISSINNQPAVNVSLAWGMTWNDRFTIGSYSTFLTNPSDFIYIFPNEFKLNLVHGGLLLAYLYPINSRLDLSAETRLGLGEIVVSYAEQGVPIAKKNVKSGQVSIGADYQLLSFLKVGGQVGFRGFDKFNFTEINDRDLNKPFLQLSLKVGNFKVLK